jgi:hypothetical protein
LARRLDGPQSQSGHYAEEKNLFPDRMKPSLSNPELIAVLAEPSQLHKKMCYNWELSVYIYNKMYYFNHQN